MTTTGDTESTGQAARDRVERYQPAAIEPRWQQRWADLRLYDTDLDDRTRPRFYLLTMYPYPSGALHIGHWYIKTPTDAIARYRRMHGDNVFLPIGFDAFGLPAENAAIKNRINPRDWTMANLDRRCGAQLRSMGATFAWDHEVVTCEPEFYRWNQWLFVQFMKKGLAYRAVSAVDWCPNDGTLAREQVEGTDRRCWRCGSKVEKRELPQWYLGITQYADDLLDFTGIDWPEPIRIMQTNWIGRSSGAEIVFETAPSAHHAGGEELRVFTTRPDTLFGATFMVLAPEHRLVASLTAPDRRAEVDAYVAAAATKTEIDRLSTDRDKTGVAIGADAINPVNGERIPIFIADYVLATYGTGAIMAVPAHDERDFAFAQAYGLPIVNGGDAQARRCGRGAHGGLHRAHVRRGHGQLGPLHRSPGGRGVARDRGLAGRAGQGRAGGDLSPARLAGQPPALLGHAHPGHPLPRVRPRAGPGAGPAGAPPGDRRLPGLGRQPAQPGRDVPGRGLPAVRRGRAARDGHDGHVLRLLLVLVPLPLAA